MLLTEKGRLILKPTPEEWIKNGLHQLDIKEVPLSNEIAILSRKLSIVHQDPTDRFITATSVYYGLTLITVDNRTYAKSTSNTVIAT